MGIPDATRDQLAVKFGVLFPHLDERQRRLLMGAEARVLGHGGVRVVAQAARVSETTVRKGVDELEAGEGPLGRVRRPGGGRKKAAEVDPGLRPALLALVEPDIRGDPISPLRWTTKSTRKLAAELTRQGHKVSADTVGDLLREEGFSLQANAKTIEGAQHSDRDAQGGFNWSSQHLVISEVWDGSSSAGGRSGGAPEVEVTGASEISASYRGGVLGRNRQGASRGGSGRGYRCGAGGGHALVPAMWRHATVRSAAAFGQVPVVF
jgi:transposase